MSGAFTMGIRWRNLGIAMVLCIVAAKTMGACASRDEGAVARVITQPQDLIGGPGAIGAVGDFLLANQQIRVIIQNKGWSRGFGIFGGGIIDADLVRPGALSTADGGLGKDNFGEFFPALLLQAFDVQDQQSYDDATGVLTTVPGVEVINDGSDGEAAVIRTRATGGDFITMAKLLAAAVPSGAVKFETDFVLHPGARHVEIVGRIKNTGDSAVDLSGESLLTLIRPFSPTVNDIQLPLGDVALFGGGNAIFAPGAVERLAARDDPRLPAVKNVGFDLRYGLEATYPVAKERGIGLPALPGVVADFLATQGPDVSYGLAAANSERNYVWVNRDLYSRDGRVKVTQHSMVVPFLMGAFAGAYYQLPPPSLQPGETFEYTRYLIVGNGDVASIRDELYRIRGEATGTLEGRVVGEWSGAGVAGASVLIMDEEGQPYSQATANADGRFRCRLAPGTYYYQVVANGRYRFPTAYEGSFNSTRFDVVEGKGRYAYIRLPEPATLDVMVRDRSGQAMPAKVSVVGHYDAAFDGLNPRDFLFDLSLGEERRHTDLSWKEPDPAKRQRRYVEARAVTDTSGAVEMKVRPSKCASDAGACRVGTYDVMVSRGPEYNIFVQRGVVLEPGKKVNIHAVLERVVDTSDFVSADMHVHGVNSVDSFAQLHDRVRDAAAEGLEVVISTDHNYITDYTPAIVATGLQDWLKGVVGVELSTLEMGHFNGFPLNYDLTSSATHLPFVKACQSGVTVNGSAFDWVECKPQQIFDQLRALGRYGPNKTIVQVNHPRDSVLGYFNQYYVNPTSGLPELPDDRNYFGSSLIAPRDRDGASQFGVDNFSMDFDALEVVNGKRGEMLHPFVVPTDAPASVIADLQNYRCKKGHDKNGAGKVLLRNGGKVAYPGAVDDWLNLLNLGHTVTATGNSDTHDHFDEIGWPRTYLYVAPQHGESQDKNVGAVSDLELVSSIQQHHVLVSTAPFLNIDAALGSAEQAASLAYSPVGSMISAPAFSVTPVHYQVKLTIRSAPWALVDTLTLYVNGVPHGDPIQVPQPDAGKALDWYTVVDLELSRDAVVVAEANGSANMFPVATPLEEPPINAADALGALASGLSASLSAGAADGISSPSLIRTVKPFALTNPIWLDVDGDGEFALPPIRTQDAPAPPAASSAVCAAEAAAATSVSGDRAGRSVTAIVPVSTSVAHTALPLLAVPKQDGGQHLPRLDIRQFFHGHAH